MSYEGTINISHAQLLDSAILFTRTDNSVNKEGLGLGNPPGPGSAKHPNG